MTETYRKCPRCKNFFLPTTEFFPPSKKRADGLHSWCRECYREYGKEKAREYRKRPDKKEYISNYNRAQRARPGFKLYLRDYNREYQRQRRHADPVFNQKCLDKTAAYIRTEHGKETKRVIDARREARKKSLPDNFSKENWARALEYFNSCCAVCGHQLVDLFGEHKAAADHWIPITSPLCPGTISTNIVPLCQGVNGCNQSKSNHDAEKWLIRKFGKRKANQVMKRVTEYFEWVQRQDKL